MTGRDETPQPERPRNDSPRAEAGRRRVRARWMAVLNAVLLVGLAFQLNYLSYRHYERWDWTAHDIYTLSDRTKAVLDELERPVEIWILLSEAEPEFGELRNLLGRYRAESDRITLHYVDPDRDPGGYREVAQRFDLGAMIVGEAQRSDVAAVVAAGERHWEITRDDLIQPQFDPLDDDDEIELNVESERAITGALVELTTGRPTRVCVTTGHAEMSLEGGGRSLAGFVREMRRENLELEEISTRGQSEVPEGCDALAIIGPNVAFSEPEAELLRRYVRGGGNLLVAADPVPNPDQTSLVSLGLEGMLRDFGVRLDRSIVLEPNPALLPEGSGNPFGPYFVVGWGEHPMTEHFRGLGVPLVVVEARSVRPIEGRGGTVLVTTSEQSFAETDLRSLQDGTGGLEADADDVPGPVPLAVATRVEPLGEARDEGEEAETEGSGGRVVVVGDASLFASDFLSQPTVLNREFASAAMGWLTEREALIAIESRTIDSQPVRMTQEDVDNLFWRVVVLIPLAFVFLGFAVWWNRRG
ncbi:MAG TPA: GldG family protein [Sandaracinaceae bacterium LLY-WYZ-13_1]|nr:GldG family protein [Sandaracinaceae bacterium LLY-WYZ-13_1]